MPNTEVGGTDGRWQRRPLLAISRGSWGKPKMVGECGEGGLPAGKPACKLESDGSTKECKLECE